MQPVKVAAVQAAPVLLDRDATISKVVALAEQAAAEGARIVAFPEAFIPGYPDWVWRTRPWDADATALYARLFDQAVVVGSAATDVLAETARRLGIWLSVWLTSATTRTPPSTTPCCTSRRMGRWPAWHRKLMPTGGERLVWGMGDGSTLKVIDTALACSARPSAGRTTCPSSPRWPPAIRPGLRLQPQRRPSPGRRHHPAGGCLVQRPGRASRTARPPAPTARRVRESQGGPDQNGITADAPARNRGADAGVLVEPGWLEAHLHDPAVRVVEVDVSRRGYDEWHIAGAVLWDVYRDLEGRRLPAR